MKQKFKRLNDAQILSNENKKMKILKIAAIMIYFYFNIILVFVQPLKTKNHVSKTCCRKLIWGFTVTRVKKQEQYFLSSYLFDVTLRETKIQYSTSPSPSIGTHLNHIDWIIIECALMISHTIQGNNCPTR